VIGVPGASAPVTTLTINDSQPAFRGATFGSVGTYEVITGTFTDEIDPSDPQNAVIVDIEHGPRNLNGTVSFTADFQIIRPTNLANSAHRVIYDLPNRGSPGPGVGTLLGSPPVNTAVPPSSGGAGNGFLMNLGWTVVEVGWDLTVPQGGALFGIHPAGGEKPRWIIGCAFRLAIPPLGQSVLALRIEPSTSIISRGTEREGRVTSELVSEIP